MYINLNPTMKAPAPRLILLFFIVSLAMHVRAAVSPMLVVITTGENSRVVVAQPQPVGSTNAPGDRTTYMTAKRVTVQEASGNVQLILEDAVIFTPPGREPVAGRQNRLQVAHSQKLTLVCDPSTWLQLDGELITAGELVRKHRTIPFPAANDRTQ